MKVRNKGFTITELVIVIAVIAILAAVLIPTFSNVIEKANQTAASSSCNVALSEYIAMVTLDGDPDNNDVTGVVFSSNNYYYVYDGEKLNYIGNSEKDNAKLLAVTSFDTDITSLTGFTKQSVEEGTAVYEGKMKFTIGEQSVEVDLSDTTRTLYLYNVDIDGTTYAGFFTINNTYGGSGNVIQTVNYSYQSGISQDEIVVAQEKATGLEDLVLENIYILSLSNTSICVGDSDGDVENQVTITNDKVQVRAHYSDSDGNTVVRILPTNEYELTNNVIDTSETGSYEITIKHTANGIEKTTTFTIIVREKEFEDYYFYNSYGWNNVYAYAWSEDKIQVRPAAYDWVLAGEILGEEPNYWTIYSSIKMFFDGENNEWTVKGLKIPNGTKFKLAQVNALNDAIDIKDLKDENQNTDYGYYVTVGNGVSYNISTDGLYNITLTNNNAEFGVYDIYWKSNNVLHIALSEDQTAINDPNFAIFTTVMTTPWNETTTGDAMSPAPEKGEGWWKISLDSRSQYVVFNNGNVDATIADGSKTRDILIDHNQPYYFDDGWHSDYTMYYFYNAYGWNEVYANATTTEPIALMSTSTSTSTDIGIRMTAVEGKPGWFAVPVASEMKTIVFSDGTDANKTDELTIDAQNQTDVYYNPNNATAGGGGWSSSFTSTTTYYFYNVRGWESVYADFGVDGGNATPWPGTLMTNNGDGWWSVEIDDNIVNNANNFVIFNDGQNGTPIGVGQTNKLKLGSYQYCTFDNWKGSKNCLTTYFFYNVNDWTNVYAYAWTGEEGSETKYLGNFPGVQMQALGNGWWSIAVDSSAVNIIFSDGSNNDANKTADLTLNSTTPYYCGENVWTAKMLTGISASYSGGVIDVDHNSQETIQFDGLVVNVVYLDGTTSLCEGYTIEVDTSSVGLKNVLIKYSIGSLGFETILENAVNVVAVLTEIEIDNGSYELYYGTGKLDSLDLVINKLYSDGTKETLTDNYTFSEFNNKNVGENNVTVTYGEFSCTFTVNVVKIVTGIVAQYIGGEISVNEQLSASDFQVTVNYEGGYSEQVTENVTVEADTSKGGTTTATVGYADKQVAVGITVVKKPQSLSVSATSTEVAHNSEVDKDNFTVTITYDDETTQELLPSEYEIKGNYSQVGYVELSFSSNGLSGKFTMLVYRVVESLNATCNKQYFVGDTVSVLDFTITVTYSNSETSEVEVDLPTVDTATAGTKTITISYTDRGKTVSCEVQVVVKETALERIEASFDNSLVLVGDDIKSHITVTAYYSDETSKQVEDWSLTYDAENAGEQLVTITYSEGSTTVSTEVTVTFTKKLTGITAVATETTVEHGGSLALTVTAFYDGGEEQVVTGFTTGFINTMDGLQKVTVTYVENGITVTTTVNVVVNPTGYRTYYFYNYAGWTDVRAHAWYNAYEEKESGDYLILGLNGNWTFENGLKMHKMTTVETGYAYIGLQVETEQSVKVANAKGEGDNNGWAWGDNLVLQPGKTYTICYYTDSNNMVLTEYVETDYDNFDQAMTQSWPGTAMQDMGDGWWYVSIDAKAENIIFNGAIGETRYQTDNLTLNPVTPYYCINGWKDTPDISDIIVLDLTEDDNWITTSPRFAVYLFNGASSDADNNGMWLDMTAIAGNSVNYYYAVDISGLDYSKFTVCRMNPESTENNWDNKWNQTVDLQLENGLCVKIKGWSTIQSSFAKGSATREV